MNRGVLLICASYSSVAEAERDKRRGMANDRCKQKTCLVFVGSQRASIDSSIAIAHLIIARHFLENPEGVSKGYFETQVQVVEYKHLF